MSDPTSSVVGRLPVALVFLSALLVLARVFGPDLEARFFPVVVDHEVAYEIVGTDGKLEIVLATVGLKARDCEGEKRTSVFVDANLNTATLVWEKGPNRVDGPGSFNLENRADLPAKIVRPVRVHTALGYRCHPFWLTPYRYPTTAAN